MMTRILFVVAFLAVASALLGMYGAQLGETFHAAAVAIRR